MQLKVILLLAVVAVAAARPDFRLPSSRHSGSDEDRSYEFDWKVDHDSDELDFGHSEKKSNGKVEGFFYVLLPDSRLQKVKYEVDGDSGFIADVSYSGEAKFDSVESRELKRRF